MRLRLGNEGAIPALQFLLGGLSFAGLQNGGFQVMVTMGSLRVLFHRCSGKLGAGDFGGSRRCGAAVELGLNVPGSRDHAITEAPPLEGP